MILMLIGQAVWVETTPADFKDGQWDPLLYISRRLEVESANPSDSGAVEFYARFDANRDGYYDLISSDAIKQTPNHEGLRLWFGSDTGYGGTNFRLFLADSGGNCDMADLNLDGWPELIHSGWGTGTCKIYWGSQAAGGPDPNNYTALPNGDAEAVFVYDLDMDSYLDILLAGDDGNLYIYWGGPSGYNASTVSTRSLNTTGHNIEVTDLNKDGWPDVVLPTGSVFAGEVVVLWGDGDRDLSNNQTWSDISGWGYTHGITLGDFNNDGWIDIVRTKYNKTFPSQARDAIVYFNNNGSFSSSNATTVNPGCCYGGSAAYDFNGDGWLDLVFFRGIAGSDATYRLVLYLNSGSPPYFSDADSVEFGPPVHYTGGFIWDFNNDGLPDIFANHGCGYGLESYVLWGVRPDGSVDSIQTLPVVDDHHGGFRECGNVYNRTPYAWYESGVFHSATLYDGAQIDWVAWDSVEIGTEITMFIRTRADGSSPWSSWVQVSNGVPVSGPPLFPAREIQYRAQFNWLNPGFMPWLERVQVQLIQPVGVSEESPTQNQKPRFGATHDAVWVLWPGHSARVRLYSADGRRVAEAPLGDGGCRFGGLGPGVYYLLISGTQTHRAKVVVR